MTDAWNSDGPDPWNEAWLEACLEARGKEWVKAWIKAWEAANLALNEWCSAAFDETRARNDVDPWRNLKEPWSADAAVEARKRHAEDPIWVSARDAKERAYREWRNNYIDDYFNSREYSDFIYYNI